MTLLPEKYQAMMQALEGFVQVDQQNPWLTQFPSHDAIRRRLSDEGIDGNKIQHLLELIADFQREAHLYLQQLKPETLQEPPAVIYFSGRDRDLYKTLTSHIDRFLIVLAFAKTFSNNEIKSSQNYRAVLYALQSYYDFFVNEGWNDLALNILEIQFLIIENSRWDSTAAKQIKFDEIEKRKAILVEEGVQTRSPEKIRNLGAEFIAMEIFINGFQYLYSRHYTQPSPRLLTGRTLMDASNFVKTLKAKLIEMCDPFFKTNDWGWEVYPEYYKLFDKYILQVRGFETELTPLENVPPLIEFPKPGNTRIEFAFPPKLKAKKGELKTLNDLLGYIIANDKNYYVGVFFQDSEEGSHIKIPSYYYKKIYSSGDDEDSISGNDSRSSSLLGRVMYVPWICDLKTILQDAIPAGNYQLKTSHFPLTDIFYHYLKPQGSAAWTDTVFLLDTNIDSIDMHIGTPSKTEVAINYQPIGDVETFKKRLLIVLTQMAQTHPHLGLLQAKSKVRVFYKTDPSSESPLSETHELKNFATRTRSRTLSGISRTRNPLARAARI